MAIKPFCESGILIPLSSIYLQELCMSISLARIVNYIENFPVILHIHFYISPWTNIVSFSIMVS